jgi:alpha-glucosidase
VLNVATQNADPDSTLQFYRKALAFRRAHPALVAGDIAFLKASEPVLAYRRSNGVESLVCVFNLSHEAVKTTLAGDADMALAEAAERKKDKLALGPNGFAIFVERPEQPLAFEFKRRAKPRR